jgi:hypothetical protein
MNMDVNTSVLIHWVVGSLSEKLNNKKILTSINQFFFIFHFSLVAFRVGYECSCQLGYELHSNKKSCETACGGILDASNGTIYSPRLVR